MKHLFKFGFVALLLLTSQLYAQAPQGINYQGVARGLDGQPLANKYISIRISILNESSSGPVEYEEVHEAKTNSFGLFTLVIGQGTHDTYDFNFIGWTTGPKWLQIEMDENGGSNFKNMGSQQLMSVPYALYAERAGNGYQAGQGIVISNNMISNAGDGDNDPNNELISAVTLGADNKLRITDAGGTKETDLSGLLGASQNLGNVLTEGNSAGNLAITDLGAPVNTSDAATKGYVDAHVDGDASATNELQDLNQVLSQGRDAGGLKIENVGTPTSNTDVATKAYVDAHSDNDASITNEIQNLSQVLVEGNDAGGLKISNIGAPVLNGDAATKAYVDAHADGDSNATNEIQDLSLAGNTLALSGDATSVNLAPYLDNTDNQNLTNVLGVGNNAGGTTITNLGAPTLNGDAATKAYVDAHADGDASPTNELQNLSNSAVGTSRTINITGGTGTTIDVADNDNSASNEIQNLSEVLTESNSAGGSRITNLGTPTANADATTKLYVDNLDALDGDKNATNEIQNLSHTVSGTNRTIDISGGTGTTIDVADNDNSPTNEIQNLSNSVSGTNRTINISGGTGTTIDVADNDNNNTNEAQSISRVGNTVTMTPVGATGGGSFSVDDNDADPANEIQNLTDVLTQNNSAGTNAITNLADPTNAQDAATKKYVDDADAVLSSMISTTYAFKTAFTYTNSSGGPLNNQQMQFTVEEFDSFNVLGGNSFTASEAGIYVFMVEGSINISIAGSQLALLFDGVKYPINLVIPFGGTQPRYSSSMMFSLGIGQTVTLVGDNVQDGDMFNGRFYGYKL